MRSRTLRVTTALCLSLSLVQVPPVVAFADQPGDCKPGDQHCQKPPPQKPQARPAPAQRQPEPPPQPKPQPQAQPAPKPVAPKPQPQPAPKPQAQPAPKPQFQQAPSHQPPAAAKPQPPAPKRQAPPTPKPQVQQAPSHQPPAPAKPQPQAPAAPPATGPQKQQGNSPQREQNSARAPGQAKPVPGRKPEAQTGSGPLPQAQPAPSPAPRNQPAAPAPLVQPQQSQPQPNPNRSGGGAKGQPGAPGLDNQHPHFVPAPKAAAPGVAAPLKPPPGAAPPAGAPQAVAPGSRPRGDGQVQRPPLAAEARGIQPGPNTHQYHIGAQDVPRSRDNGFHRRPQRQGLSDFEKFGLIALGAATIGAILSNGDRVVDNYGDSVVYTNPEGRYGIYHDDDALIRRPGDMVETETFSDGSVLTRVTQPDGTVIRTLRSRHGRVLRREVFYPGGRNVMLFDDTRRLPPPVVTELPPQSPVDILYTGSTNPALLRSAFETQPIQPPGRFFTLEQIRDTPAVRYLAPEVEIGTLAFASGSSAIPPDQAQSLGPLAHVMVDMISQNPAEVFLVEGHTDTVGDPATNLAISQARAQATALALTEYFGVPPQNMVTQGYGEYDLKDRVQGADDANRRVVLRRVTGLLPPPGQ